MNDRTMRFGAIKPGVGAATLFGLPIFSAFLVTLAGTAWSSERIFDISSQSVATALVEFANQSAYSLVAPGLNLDGMATDGIEGALEPDEALEKLLSGTGLVFSHTSDDAVVIERIQRAPGRERSFIGPTLDGVRLAQAGDAADTQDEELAMDVASTEGPSRIDEIVVTSRRRQEFLQDVPEQITVFTGAEIDDAQIENYQDFANLTPNFQTFENFRRGVFNITVRGIPTVQGGEAPVTILVDGVQVSGLDFINQDLFDLDNIQILRGPQGAAYGRGAIGGAILVNTRQPGNEFEGRVEGIWTDEVGEYRVSGSVSGPIVKDKLLFRLAGTYSDRNGFLTNSLAGGKCDFQKEKVFRGQVKFLPTDNLTIDGKINYLDGRNYASCFTFATDANPLLDGKGFPKDLPRDFKQFDNRDIIEGSVKIEWDLPYGTLTNASSYQDSDSFSPGDVDFGPIIQPVFFENPVFVESWNTDLHFVSSETENLTWVVGGFFQRRATNNLLRVGFGPPPLVIEPFFVDSDQKDISRAWALYGEATYQVLENLEISAAVRFDSDKRESEDRNAPGSFIEKRFTAWQPRGSVTYNWNDDLMTYFSVGRGFRSGGFNSLADTLAVGLTDRLFDKETATNYEVGLKASLMDGKVTVSGALFRTVFDNQQNFLIDTENIARIVLTFPKTRINGLEFEVAARPVEGLDLRASIGVADGEITDGGSFGLTGANSPNANKYTANLSAQYVFPLSAALDLRARVDYERRGPIYWDQFDKFKSPSTDFINLFAAVEQEHWSAGVFVKNATDERTPALFSADSFGPGVHGILQNLPRRWGFELRAQL